jgi:hypothetical protein
MPLAKWLTSDLKECMLDYLGQERLDRQGLFHYPYVKQLIDEQLNKSNDHRRLLWTLLMFQTSTRDTLEQKEQYCCRHQAA